MPLKQFMKTKILAKIGFLLINLILAGIVVRIAKFIFGRPRPSYGWINKLNNFQWFELKADLQSFPSGHACTQASIFISLCFLYPRLALWWLMGMIITLPSSLFVKQHFATDVMAATFCSIFMAILIIITYRNYNLPPFKKLPK